MSNVHESSDFANFVHLYKQYVDSQSQGNPQPLAGPQQPLSQVRRSTPQHLSPAHRRRQPPRQPPFRNSAELSTFFRALDEVKRRQEEIYVAVSALQTMADQIKKTVDDGVARMVGMERFELIGRGVLEMAVQPSNSQLPNSASSQLHSSNPSQPSQHASQPPTSSNLQRTYSGTNATQPPHIQYIYAPPASQAQESFSEPYIEYSGFDFLANDTS